MDPKQCLLLMLPAELRNTIYSYILVQPSGLCEDRSLPGSSPSTARRRFCANILLTCKQINEEGSPILYGQNIFAADASLLAEWPFLLLNLRSRHRLAKPVYLSRPRSMIRRYHISIRLDTDPRFDRKRLQESFSSAEELEVQVSQAMYGGCDFSVLELFEDIRGIGKARVVGSIGDGRYAAWLEASMMSPCGHEMQPFERS